MKPIRFRRVAEAAAALLSTAAGTAYRRVLPNAPVRRAAQVSVPGAQVPVEVRWDAWGVPHVYAGSEHDAFLLQGYLHAEERLWQMELHRRIGAGRLSELFGERTLEADRFLRRVGLHRAAQEEAERLEGGGKAMMEAYCLGINVWLESHKRLPLEFCLLGFRPEAWRTTDCLLWGKLMSWGLALNWDVELFRAGLAERIGPEATAALDWPYPEGHPITICPSDVSPPDTRREANTLHALSALFGGGSNSWSISGTRTATGKPILANDPHLVPQLPSVWYEMHLECPEFRVAGASLPGVPGIMIGHNERIAWGVTAGMVDTQDVYVERLETENVERIREQITVKGRPEPVIEEVTITKHGPVISGSYALRSTLLEPGRVAEAALALLKAGDWPEFRAALAKWDVPSLNFLYADVDGNIGYQLVGLTPRRPPGSGIVPLPGWTGEHEWDGYLSQDELPSAFNPPEGYLVNANEKQTADGEGPYLAGEWVDGYRAKRIAQMIVAEPAASVQDMQRMQTDILSLPALEVQELLRRHASPSEAREMLLNWDGRMLPDSRAAALYGVFRVKLFGAVLQRRLGEKADAYFGIPVHPLATTSSYQFRGTSGVLRMVSEDGQDGILDQALDEAFAEVKGAAWGRLHYVTFQHPLGVVRALGRLLNRGPYPVGGDGDTVLQSSFSFRTPYDANRWLPSLRFVADTSDWDRSLFVHAPGQSGRPGSRHYDDQLPLWLQGKSHQMPFSRPAVDAATETVQRFEPD